MKKNYDKIILGAGLYGLYSALICGARDQNILVLEFDSAPFERATFINQARVHMGYHYPRSYSTAIKSAKYFQRFNDDFGFCINASFDKIYAISKNFSWTSGNQFKKFCLDSNIPCEEVEASKYFKNGTCEAAFITKEYTYDANILKDFIIEKIKENKNVDFIYNARIKNIEKHSSNFEINMIDNSKFTTNFILNATYASTNQIIKMLGFSPFKIKYELCEIILCNATEILKNIGVTVMDGPFFSIMPFGKTGLHSLTSVTFTPHLTSYETLPTFSCQDYSNKYCSPYQLGNCNKCPAKPNSAWEYMNKIASKYMIPSLKFSFSHSLFSMKPILTNSEIDDSRPTLIKCFSKNPTFISVLSGKINTVYDLDEVLIND